MKKNKILVFLLAAVSTTAIAAAGCKPAGNSGKGHTHSYVWNSDAEDHWEECVDGDNAKEKESHVDAVNNDTNADGADGKCDVCGRANHLVTFDVQGHGTAPAAQTVYEGGKVVNPGTIVEAGLIFSGWYEDAACTTEFDFDGTTISSPTTIYAKWSVTVTFDTKGHGTAPDAQTVKLGGTVEEPVDPEYDGDGYVFGGWCLTSDGTDVYDFTTPVTEAITLYAIWVVDTRPLVTFDLGEEGDNATYATQRVAEGGYATKPATDPEIDGYLFAGWYAEDGGTEFDFENTAINADTKIVAHWTVDERIMFKFDVQGIGEAPATQKLSEGEKPTRPADPSAAGYTFAGWYANPECDGDEYDFTSDVSGDTTVYAKWTVVVTFDVQGHGTAPEAQNVKVGGLVSKPADDPVDVDPEYVFDGWYKDADCTEKFDFNSDTVDSATTIYAKWKIVYPELELETQYTTSFGTKTELKFTFTAQEMGRYEFSLIGNSTQKCYFTTDLPEDDGVFYGAGYEKDVKELDLYARNTVIITLYRPAEGVEDDSLLRVLVSEINNEEFPDSSWTGGKYVGSKYTIDFNKNAKQVTLNYSELGSNSISAYLGGSFNSAYFTVGSNDYTLKEVEPGTLALTVKNSNGSTTDTDTLYYVEPQAALDMSAFAGTYKPADSGMSYNGLGTVSEIVIYANGNAYLLYGSTSNPTKVEYTYGVGGGSSYTRSDGSDYNIFKLSTNYVLVANLSGGSVVSVNVQRVDSTGIYVYNRTGDAPVEIPKVLPVDYNVNYAGQQFLYTARNANSHSAYYYANKELNYLGKFDITDYKPDTGRYIIEYYVTYGSNLTMEAAVTGTEGDYTIELYQNGGLYDTLTPIVYHDITPDEEVTINTSEFVLGIAYYYKPTADGTYTVSLSTDNEGNYNFDASGRNDQGSIHIHDEVYEGSLASFDCNLGCIGNGGKITVSAGQLIAIHIGTNAAKPATIKVKFEAQGGGSGNEGGLTVTKYYVGWSGETDTWVGINISSLAAGEYKIHINCPDAFLFDTPTYHFAFALTESGSDQSLQGMSGSFTGEAEGTITIPENVTTLYIYAYPGGNLATVTLEKV